MDARYYRILASALPAADLGMAAVRRLRRETLRRLRHALPPPGPPRVLRAFGVDTLDKLADRLRSQRAARGPLEANELPRAVGLLEQSLPGFAAAATLRADRILAGEAWLFGAWRSVSRGELAPGIAAFDWRRDPMHGAIFPDKPSREIDRDALGTDSRATWELARLAHVHWLAIAETVNGARGTGSSRGAAQPGIYARAAALHVRDFLATQPVDRGIHWTCPMEASLRAIQLGLSLLLLRNSPQLDAFFWAEVAGALLEHGRFIEAELEDGQTVPGNHLLADLAGLAVLGLLFPELPGAASWRTRALPRFGEELLRQTRDSGLSFEASIPYHRFATELALLVEHLARRQGLTLGDEVLHRLHAMVGVVRNATLTDGLLVNLGDNDASAAFSVQPRTSLDPRPVEALARALWHDGPPVAEAEALWIAGIAGFLGGVRPGGTPHVRQTTPALGIVADGGRSASLWAGDNGQLGLGGHAHNDKLATEVVLGGRRIAVDPGCPVYIGDVQERDAYRSTRAHPTVRIDLQEQCELPTGRPFLLPDQGSRATLLESSPRRIRGEHRAWMRLKPGCVHRREIAVPEQVAAVCITDTLVGDGGHLIEVQWPLTTRAVEIRPPLRNELRLIEKLEALSVGEGRFDTSQLVVIGGGADVVLLAFASQQPFELELTESTWSPGYAERVPGRTVRARFRAQLPLVVTSAFVQAPAVERRNSIPADDSAGHGGRG